MASDTFKTKKVGAVYAGPAGHCKKSRLYKVGEAGIYPGYAVRATAGAVYLAKNSDKKFSGIAECMGGHDAFVDPKGTIWEAYMPYGAVKNCCDLKCHLFEYRFGKRPVRSAKSTEGVLRAPVEAAQHRRTRRNLTDVNMSAGD